MSIIGFTGSLANGYFVHTFVSDESLLSVLLNKVLKLDYVIQYS